MRVFRWIAAMAVLCFTSAACIPDSRFEAIIKTLPSAPLPMAAVPPLAGTPGNSPAPPLSNSAPTASAGKPAWSRAALSEWGMQNAAFDARGLGPVAASTKPLVVVGRQNSLGQPWPRAEVDAARANKWLLAYMSVGEAQMSEWYWQSGWGVGNPPWIVGNSPYFGNNVYTDLGSTAWAEVLHRTLDRIIDQGFDGAFLDVVDVYWFPNYPGGPSQLNMARGATMVCNLAIYARSRVPGFKLIVNNAINLVADFPGYGACLDGEVVEGLWWIGIGQARDEFYRAQKVGELGTHLAAGIPVFSVDYAPVSEANAVAAAARSLGYAPYIASEGLDAPLR